MGILLLVLSMALGVLGVLRETRDKSGKVTVAGKWTVAGIVISALLGIAQQIKDSTDKSREVKQARELAEKQLASIQRTVRDIDRNMQLLSPEFSADIEISVPCEDLQSQPELPPVELCGTRHPFFLASASLKAQRFVRKYYIQQFNIFLFGRGEAASADRFKADLVATFWPERSNVEVFTGYDKRTQRARFTYHRALVKMMQSNNRILSLPDLSGAPVGIMFPNMGEHDFNVLSATIITPMGVSIPIEGISRSSSTIPFFVGKASVKNG
jgi:hypothetical protein